MPYTLWSKGRLLGHTDFGFIANTDEHKMGWFHPTEVGEQILQVMTEPGRVISGYRKGGDIAQIEADLAAAGDRIEALELELRSPEGKVLETKDIGVNDTERLLALAAECEEESELEFLDDPDLRDEIDASVAHDLEILRFDDIEEDTEDEGEQEWPRYQILAFF